MGGDSQTNDLRDTEARIFMLVGFFYMIDTLNGGSTYSIMVNMDDCRLMYYFLELGITDTA